MDGARTPRRVRARARARARSAGRRRPSAGRERTEGRVAVGSSRTPPVVGRGASSSDESAIVCAHGGGKKVRSRQSARSRDPSAGFQTRWSAGTSSRWRCTRLPSRAQLFTRLLATAHAAPARSGHAAAERARARRARQAAGPRPTLAPPRWGGGGRACTIARPCALAPAWIDLPAPLECFPYSAFLSCHELFFQTSARHNGVAVGGRAR